MTSARPIVLVTGGAGFIGSHTCLDLLTHGYEVVSVDSYANSSPMALARVSELAGRPLLAAYTLDLADGHALDAVFTRHQVHAVLHFAARKSVGESVKEPLAYYATNLRTTLTLLERMRAHDVHRLVFSSSCSIYGDATTGLITEDAPKAPTNPYARTKLATEQILADLCAQLPDWHAIALRYFNPAGAHGSGRLGEDPTNAPLNLMPYLAQVAVGRREAVTVFGDDWPTPDGTCVRDYLHVEDVAAGHRVALEHLDDEPGLRGVNLGSGAGTSVLQLIHAFETASGRTIPVRFEGRRAGDVATLVADPARANAWWGWQAQHDVERMCADAWRFQQTHPLGYQHSSSATSAPALSAH